MYDNDMFMKNPQMGNEVTRKIHNTPLEDQQRCTIK